MITWFKQLFNKFFKRKKELKEDPNYIHLKNKDPFIY